MANLATLKAALNAAVYQNTQNAITGESLNTILNSIIDTLGTGYRYAGVATPSANPGTIDNRVFYLATAAGTYTNFGAVQLDGKSLHVFIYDTTWHDIALDVPTTAALAVVAGSGENAVKGKYPSITASGDGAHAIGFSNEDEDFTLSATGEGAHAEGDAYGGNIIASGDGAHAEGCAEGANITASNLGSHAEGCAGEGGEITASENGAHAEGYAVANDISASGEGAHAEGYASDGNIIAVGLGAHAEGCTEGSGDITASGKGAHAEGSGSTASGDCSHAEGSSTIAQNTAEHAEGKYNLSHKKTTGTAAEQAAGSTLSSVGCGTSANDRKNAIEVMQNGDVYIKDVGGYDGTNPAETGVSPIQKALKHIIPFDFNITSSGLAEEVESIDDLTEVFFVRDSAALNKVYRKSDSLKLREQIFNILKSRLIADGVSIPDIGSVVWFGVTGDFYEDDIPDIVHGCICMIYSQDPSSFYFYSDDRS